MIVNHLRNPGCVAGAALGSVIWSLIHQIHGTFARPLIARLINRQHVPCITPMSILAGQDLATPHFAVLNPFWISQNRGGSCFMVDHQGPRTSSSDYSSYFPSAGKHNRHCEDWMQSPYCHIPRKPTKCRPFRQKIVLEDSRTVNTFSIRSPLCLHSIRILPNISRTPLLGL